jgi:hypothetical protein
VDFDETGIGGDFLQVGHDRVETLDVAGLQDHASSPAPAVTNSAAWAALSVIGFSTKHVLAGGEEGGWPGRNGWCVGVTTLKASAPARASSSEAKRPGRGSFSAILAPCGPGDVINAGEDGLAGGGEVRIKTGVFLAQSSDPDARRR